MLPELERFSSSLAVDYELYPYDIAGSVAHARALKAAKVINAAQLTAIERGLRRVKKELDEGTFEFAPTDEDIHTAVERRLTELTPHGARLHAGRSRNDQVALDLRLYCRDGAHEAIQLLSELIDALASRAAAHADWLMPGYTHLQRAQPVTVGYHLLAHAEPLMRDALRFRFASESAAQVPAGAAALAGTILPLAQRGHAMDAVADRDFALDLVYACTSTSVHLSRLGEDVVLWATSEFGFVDLADEIATGSSLMPQKKNPDIAELLRGRAGRSIGSFVALATVLKGLPLAYDRDLQEDKPAVFAAVDNALDSIRAATLLVKHLEFNRERMASAAADPLLLATDAAEELVRAGMPFRKAHEQVGKQVRDGSFAAPWDAQTSLRKRRLDVARRAKAMRKEAAALRR